MEIVSKDAGDRFDREMSRGYLMKEDYIDAGGAVSGHTRYPIIDQLKGESQKRRLRVFGNDDECNIFIEKYPSLRGIPKGTARVLMAEKDSSAQVKAIEKLGMELIRGKGVTPLMKRRLMDLGISQFPYPYPVE